MKTNIKSWIFSNCKKHSKTWLRTKKWGKEYLNNILIILYIQYIFSYGSNKKTCNTNPRNVNIKWNRDGFWEREKVQLSLCLRSFLCMNDAAWKTSVQKWFPVLGRRTCALIDAPAPFQSIPTLTGGPGENRQTVWWREIAWVGDSDDKGGW